MIKLFKELGIWQENDSIIPNIGDIIFYDWHDNGIGDNTGLSDHVGIITEIEKNIMTVMEGNKNNKVGKRYITINGKYIRGYAQPKYESRPYQIAYLEVAKEVIQGVWGNGMERKKKLSDGGYDYTIIQSLVNTLLRG